MVGEQLLPPPPLAEGDVRGGPHEQRGTGAQHVQLALDLGEDGLLARISRGKTATGTHEAGVGNGPR